MIRLSLLNLALDATVAATSEDGAYPATNLQMNGRPYVPWKSVGLGNQRVTLFLGSPKELDVLYLNMPNFATAQLQGNNTDDWASPSWTMDLTVRKNRWTRRYQYGSALDGFNYPYVSLYIPSQLPIDGAGAYRLGGLWLGDDLLRPPRSIRYDVAMETVEPAIQTQLASQAVQVLDVGPTFARFQFTRTVKIDRLTPGQSDDIDRWLDLEEQIKAGGRFLFMKSADTVDSYIVQRTSDLKFDRQRLNRMSNNMTLVESSGP